MKKLLFLSVFVVIIMIFMRYYFYFGNDSNLSTNTEQPLDILFKDFCVNNAWGYYNSGYVICRDGSVYSYDYGEGKEVPTIECEGVSVEYKGYEEYFLSNAELYQNIKVSKTDLKRMIKYSSYIDSGKHSKKEQNNIADAGSHIIEMYDYKNKAIISLSITVTFTLKNTSPHANDLVRLIEKYTNKARLEDERERVKEEARIEKEKAEHEAQWRKEDIDNL